VSILLAPRSTHDQAVAFHTSRHDRRGRPATAGSTLDDRRIDSDWVDRSATVANRYREMEFILSGREDSVVSVVTPKRG